MASLTDDFPDLLLESREGPCLSLYQPTHRNHPDDQQDPIRFRNGIKLLENSLRRDYPNREIRSLLGPFRELADNRTFWNTGLDGSPCSARPASSAPIGCSAAFPSERWWPTLSMSSRCCACCSRPIATGCSA